MYNSDKDSSEGSTSQEENPEEKAAYDNDEFQLIFQNARNYGLPFLFSLKENIFMFTPKQIARLVEFAVGILKGQEFPGEFDFLWDSIYIPGVEIPLKQYPQTKEQLAFLEYWRPVSFIYNQILDDFEQQHQFPIRRLEIHKQHQTLRKMQIFFQTVSQIDKATFNLYEQGLINYCCQDVYNRYLKLSPHRSKKPYENQLKPKRSAESNTSPVCCRKSFFLHELLPLQEGLKIQFKNWGWPLKDVDLRLTLRKTISGFMNCQGGIILCGVTNNGCVVGEFYDDDRKRDAIYEIDQARHNIFPRSPFQVDFLPVRSLRTNRIIRGCFVIRIDVPRGKGNVIHQVRFLGLKSQFYRTGSSFLHNDAKVKQELQPRQEHECARPPDVGFSISPKSWPKPPADVHKDKRTQPSRPNVMYLIGFGIRDKQKWIKYVLKGVQRSSPKVFTDSVVLLKFHPDQRERIIENLSWQFKFATSVMLPTTTLNIEEDRRFDEAIESLRKRRYAPKKVKDSVKRLVFRTVEQSLVALQYLLKKIGGKIFFHPSRYFM